METRKVNESEWQKYFDRLSKTSGENYIEIEVEGTSIGSQREVNSISLQGISYDPKSKEVFVFMDGNTHAIRRPKEIFLSAEGGAVKLIAITDQDGNKQLIKFKNPVALSA